MKHIITYQIFEALSPVSQETVDKIFAIMNKGDVDYHEAVKAVWSTIPFSDKVIIYNPAYTWVNADDLEKLKVVRRFSDMKSML